MGRNSYESWCQKCEKGFRVEIGNPPICPSCGILCLAAVKFFDENKSETASRDNISLSKEQKKRTNFVKVK